jgi:hypothetical protein
MNNKAHQDQAQWFKPIILVTWYAEIRKIAIQGLPREKLKILKFRATQHKVRPHLKNNQCKMDCRKTD